MKISEIITDKYKLRISPTVYYDLLADVVEAEEEQEKKTGHWIAIDEELSRYKCSECGEVIRLYKKSEISKLEKDETLSDYPFSHCGCRMVEPQESEDKE